MSENELREAFRDLASGVKVAPDPYRRVMKRERNQRRVRAAGWTTATAAAIAATLLVPVGLKGLAGPGPMAFPSSSAPDFVSHPLTPWISKLIESPTRGALADDAAFIDAFTERLSQQHKTSAHLKVLFAEDIGESRVVIAAFYNSTHHVGVFMSSPAGAGGAEMAERTTEANPDADGIPTTFSMLEPFSVRGFHRVGVFETNIMVALAPSECELATASLDSDPLEWRPAVGGYASFTNQDHTVAARVTCQGVVRHQAVMAVPMRVIARTVTDAEVVAAGAERARGAVPNEVARRLLNRPHCDRPVAESMLLFGGTVPGEENGEPLYVATCPTSSGEWFVQVEVEDGRGSEWKTEVDLGPPSSIVVVQPWDPKISKRSLVLAPRSAVRLEVSTDTGTLLDTQPMGAGVGSIVVPEGQTLRLRAFDADGTEVGNGVAPMPRAPLPGVGKVEYIDNWG